MGYLRDSIIEYLRAEGARPNSDIYEKMQQDYRASMESVRQVLHRMTQSGILERRARGWYALSKDSIFAKDDRLVCSPTHILVIGALDHLFREYPDTMTMELRRRGWKR